MLPWQRTNKTTVFLVSGNPASHFRVDTLIERLDVRTAQSAGNTEVV